MIPKKKKDKIIFLKKHLLNNGKLSEFGDADAESLYHFMRRHAKEFSDLKWTRESNMFSLAEYREQQMNKIRRKRGVC